MKRGPSNHPLAAIPTPPLHPCPLRPPSPRSAIRPLPSVFRHQIRLNPAKSGYKNLKISQSGYRFENKITKRTHFQKYTNPSPSAIYAQAASTSLQKRTHLPPIIAAPPSDFGLWILDSSAVVPNRAKSYGGGRPIPRSAFRPPCFIHIIASRYDDFILATKLGLRYFRSNDLHR